MATYTQREKTRLEHQWEIAREVSYRDFVDVEAKLAVWVDDRAWTTGDGPVTVFNGAVGWLREREVLLPGVTLARLVARERDAATLRVWTDLAQPMSGGQARLLRGLLVVPEGSRRSELDRMRKAETLTSGAGMVRALRRISDVAGLGLGGLDVSAVPHRRVIAGREKRRSVVCAPSATAMRAQARCIGVDRRSSHGPSQPIGVFRNPLSRVGVILGISACPTGSIDTHRCSRRPRRTMPTST